MNFLIDNWLLVLVAAVSGGMLLWPTLRGSAAAAGAIGPGEAVRLINREKAVLIDVSDPTEFAAGHASGSRNVPLPQLEGSKDLPSNKTLPLVVLCSTGRRAARAASTLKRLGYANAQALSGGLAAWREANLPVERSSA